MGRKRKYFKPVTFRVKKRHYKRIMEDVDENGNVGNVMRRIVREHYNRNLFKYRIRNSLTDVMTNKKILALLAIIGIVGLGAGLMSIGSIGTQAAVEEGARIRGWVTVYKNGELVYEGPNVLTNVGANLIRSYLTGDAGPAISLIAVGNGSAPVAGSTSLDNEIPDCGLSNATGTLATQGTGNWSYMYTWTSSCDNEVVNTSAMFNGTGGTMAWGDAFSQATTLASSDTLQVTWNVSVSGT